MKKTVTLQYCPACPGWQGTRLKCDKCGATTEPKEVPARRANMYFIDELDSPVPSVTTVLKVLAAPGLEFWKIRTAVTAALSDPTLSVEEAMAAIYVKRDTAGGEGSDAHRIIENISLSGDQGIEYKGKVGGYINAYRKFVKDVPHKILAAETVVYSKVHGYAGQIDAVIELPSGRRVLIDYKTSNQIVPEYHLQLAAYLNALKEMGKQIDGAAILHLCEDGTYSFIDSAADIEVFLACLKLFKWTKK